MRLALAFVVAIGCRTGSTAPPQAETADPERPAGAVGAAIAALSAVDVEVRSGRMKVQTVSETEAKAEMARRTDAIWSDERAQRLFGLTWLLGGNAVLGVDLSVVRKGLHLGAARPTLAYYAPERIVFIDKAATKVLPRDLIIMHELVHAYQDQELGGGLFKRLAATSTIDALGVAQLATEGHAQFVAMDAYLKSQGVTERPIPASMFRGGAERLTSPSSALVYESGALAMRAAQERGGRKAVESLWRKLPPSTEQMLHPTKLGVDAPTVVPAPDLPGAQRRWDDTIGELMMRALLSQHFPDDVPAVLGTMGWDGDRLAWFDTDEGPILVWRTVWDRPADAIQFLNALRGVKTASNTASVIVVDNRVDVVVVAPPAGLEQAEAICKQLPALAAFDGADAKSTEAMERAYLADVVGEAIVGEDGIHVRDSGVRIPIPKGWSHLRIRGSHALRAPMVDGFGDNLVVAVTPNLLRYTLDQVETETLRHFREVLGSKVLRTQRVQLAGREAWIAETLGHEVGSTMELHQIYVVFFTPTHRVVITASSLPSRWPTVGPIFESTLEATQPV